MKKLYNDKDYAKMALKANKEGKKLYVLTSYREFEVDVPEYKIVQEEVNNLKYDEDGNIVYQDGQPVYEITTQEIYEPVMVEKEITNSYTVTDENGESKIITETTTTMVQSYKKEKQKKQYAELVIAEDGYYICYVENYTDGTINKDFQKQKQELERRQLDSLSLTPADVERALYRAKSMDFEDLKVFIKEKMPIMDIKAISIELRANLFYRGATMPDGTRLIDTIGAILGYSSEDMDYLFKNKQLPTK